jgi:hypothetical protein
LRPAIASAVLVCLGLQVSCSESTRVPNVEFSGPGGLVVAGSNFDHLFIANTGTDAVQVARLTPALRDVDMVPAPARYFPLHIPAGPNPTELAATHDGRYVLALDIIDNTLRVIDGDTMTLVLDTARGVTPAPLLKLPLNPREGLPAGMAGSPLPCDREGCLGRAYVAMRAAGTILTVDVLESASKTLSLDVSRLYPVGGAPLRLAAHPTEALLYMTDAASPELVQLDLTTGKLVRAPLGGVGGPIAVSEDWIAVGRPETRDVVVLTGAAGKIAQGPFVAVDTNPTFTPAPACLPACVGADPGSCRGAHEADLGVCASEVGLVSGPAPYGAVYTGVIPGQLSFLHHKITEQCAPQGDAASVAFADGIAVAGLDGTLHFIGVQPGSPPSIRLLETHRCVENNVTIPGGQAAKLGDFLAECPATPDGRNRYACLGAPGEATKHVAVLRGAAHGQRWSFQWEAVLPNGDRSAGGGVIDDAGRLGDNALDLGQLGIRPQQLDVLGSKAARGDVVTILTQPRLTDPACRTALGLSETESFDLCKLERRVKAVEKDATGRSVLVLDRPLDRACFNAGEVAYRVRAGDAFLVSASDINGAPAVPPTRIGPGDIYTPAGIPHASPAVAFALRADGLYGAELDACARYDGNGAPRGGVDAVFSRVGAVSFIINDAFASARTNLSFDLIGNPTGTLGKIPGGMAMTRDRNDVPGRLYVTFAGSASLLISDPQKTGDLLAVDNGFKVLQ